MSKEKRLVPELRFPGFDGEWSRSRLKEITNIYDGTHKTPTYTKKGVRFLSVENIPVFDKSIKYISQEDYEKSYKNKAVINDIFITRIGEIGRAAILTDDKEYAYYVSLALIKNKDSEMYPLFVYYYILNNVFQKELHSRTLHIAFPKKINLGEIGKCLFAFPSKKEQQKIATFLSLVDKKIDLLEKRVELLEEQKRGLLQQIFSQKIRFKKDDGSEFEDWEKTALGNIFTERKKYSSKGLEFPHVSLTKEGVVPKSERYERDFLVRSDDKKYKITYFNDICYNPANLKFGVISRNKFGSAIFSPIYVTFKVDKNFDSEFMEYFITRKDLINKLRRYEEGTVYERMAVKPSDFLSFSFYLPKFEEQKKIADFLSKHDFLIDNSKQKLESTKEIKKGLLQKMFI